MDTGTLVAIGLFALLHVGTAIYVVGKLSTDVRNLSRDGEELRNEMKGLRREIGHLATSLARLEGKVNGIRT